MKKTFWNRTHKWIFSLFKLIYISYYRSARYVGNSLLFSNLYFFASCAWLLHYTLYQMIGHEYEGEGARERFYGWGGARGVLSYFFSP